MSQIARMHSRRAFTIVPLALVLWIGLIILGVMLYLKTPPQGYVPAKGVGPGQIGSIILAVVYGGFWVLMLSPIAEKKGHTWANVAAVITLGFAGLMLTLSYFGLSADQRNLAGKGPQPGASTPSAAPSASPTSPKSMAEAMRDAAEQNKQTAEAALRSQQEALQSQREAIERARQPGVPSGAPTPSPTGTPVSRPESPTTTSAPASGAPGPRPATPVNPDDATIKRTLEEFAAKLGTQSSEAATVIRTELDALTKPPRQDIRDLKARIEKLNAVREILVTLKSALNRAGEEAGDALIAAGIDQTKARAEGGVWGARAGMASRAFAADRLLGTIDKGIDEATLMRDNLGKWKIDKNGEITSKDFKLQSVIRSARFFLDAGLERSRKDLDSLRGE